MENNVKNTLQVHSQAKVEFYEKYLKSYLRILYSAENINRINIYDVFCGMGIYDDGGKGSPIVAFDAIKELALDKQFKRTSTQVTLILNDIKLPKIENVKNYINVNNTDSNNCKYCEVEYYNCDIEQMFNTILQKVSYTAKDTRNLIFIDPYGYKNVKKETIYQLMENGKTEIILFLPIYQMRRFTQKAIQDEETVQYKPLREFVNSFFNADHEMIKGLPPVMEYIQFIAEALKYDKFYATSYYIERDSTKYFALFFISSHILGFEKILNVKWKLDEDAGRGFRIQPEQAGFFDEQFKQLKKEENAKRLEAILLELLKEPKTNVQVYEETLRHEFLPKHATAIFEKWQSNKPNFKVYDIKTGLEARKKSFYIPNGSHKEAKVEFRIEKSENDKN